MPQAAELAATELARLPVEAQAIILKPSSRALDMATETTLSLNERVGKLTASFLRYSSRTPSALPRLCALTRGVKPTCMPTVGSDSSGSSSLYRHMFGGLFSIVWWFNAS